MAKFNIGSVPRYRRTEAYVKMKSKADSLIYFEAKELEKTVTTVKEINKILSQKNNCSEMTIYNTIKRHEKRNNN